MVTELPSCARHWRFCQRTGLELTLHSFSLHVEISGKQSSGPKAATFFFFSKSICLNTFCLKGKNVSAFQVGGLLGSGWLCVHKLWQRVCACMHERVCTHVLAHSPTCPLTRVSLRESAFLGTGWARGRDGAGMGQHSPVWPWLAETV